MNINIFLYVFIIFAAYFIAVSISCLCALNTIYCYCRQFKKTDHS